MRKPLYKVGEKLTYTRQDRKATILEVVHPDTGHDARHHGFRYIVRIGNFVWSVPEWTLEPVKFDPKEIKRLEE